MLPVADAPPWERRRVPAVVTTKLLLEGVDEGARAHLRPAAAGGAAVADESGLRDCELRALRAATELTLSFKSACVAVVGVAHRRRLPPPPPRAHRLAPPPPAQAW